MPHVIVGIPQVNWSAAVPRPLVPSLPPNILVVFNLLMPDSTKH